MKSVRQAIEKSWFPQMTLIRSDLAMCLQLSHPLSLTELTRYLDAPEVRSFRKPLDADALHGEVEFIMRSDGSYTFRGHMRATGFPSFEFTVQAFLRSASGTVVALQKSGRVFGTDTPGDRQRDWEESATSNFIRDYWMDLRSDAQLDTNLEKSLSGITGGVVDVAKAVLETYVAAQTAGTVGAIIVLGAELGSAAGGIYIDPNILAGVTVGGGVLVLFGPSAIIPAVVAGTATALLADIKHRSMRDDEIALAQTVFGAALPIDRIRVTNLHHPIVRHGIAREFVMPGIDGSILVNMGRNFDHTLEPDVQRRTVYSQPGELFIHELTHAWQVRYHSFMPGLICEGIFDDDYDYRSKLAEHAPWSSFGPEQQAALVNSWFGAHWADNGKLESPQSLSDARFPYIARNIRAGVS